jgi:type IX secretion system PorP/SprF family membrane protein
MSAFHLTEKLRGICSWLAAICVAFFCFFNNTGLRAQDLHFSQFMNNPLLTNPANTGFNPDFDYRIGASYRDQWSSLPVPYKTMSIWGDAQVFRNRFQNGWLGVGGVILRDAAGSGNLTSTKAYGSIAYHQELGVGSLLSAGFNIGYAAKRIDIANFKWENQWNGKFFDANASSGEQFAYSQIGYIDLQAGLNYAYFVSDNLYLNAGVSLMHINKPRESFFSENKSDNRVPQRYTGFVNASYKVNDQWIINPNVYYSYQSGASEIVGGMMAQYNLSGDGEMQLIGGAYYRAGDAAVAMIGLQWSNIRLSFSYDASTSAIRNYNNGNGALEFSLIKFGEYSVSTPRQSRCPAF